MACEMAPSLNYFWTDCHDTQFRVFFYPLYLLQPANTGASAYNAEIMAFLIMKFIHGWEAVGNKLNKRNELLITESQCDFFCFIPSAWVKNSKLANTKMTSSAYLFCFANTGLRRMSLFVSRAKHEPHPFLTSLNFRHSFESYTPLSDVNRKPGSDFDWLIAEWSIRLEGMSEN